jgi:acetyltransferase-like isoleucine patch superfamily enzyme
MPEQIFFYPLIPGEPLPVDTFNFPIPNNIKVGENVVIDSSSCFKNYYSKLPVGLKLGNHITIQSSSLSIEKNGYVEIGDYSYISYASFAVSEKIIIGKYVFIAGGATIVDTDFHPSDPAKRMIDTIAISTVGDKSRRPFFDTSPVIIEDGVWIGYNATILKGVRIGKDSIIQPGAVVTKNIPAQSIVVGNPAIITALG